MPSASLPAHASFLSRWGWMIVAVLALVPSLGTWSAPWIAEDSALLEQAATTGPLADWTRPQGGLSVVRFWRPVVSLSWSLQERWTGLDPGALRIANVLLHLACALLAGRLVLALGGRPWGAFLAAGWVATFPDQGGTVTWLAGRTDLLSGLGLLVGLLVALGRRPWLAAPVAFLAGATKEFGFLLPLWVVALALARGDRGRALVRTSTPAVLGAGLAFLVRRLALGAWIGGYPAGPGDAPLGIDRAAGALFEAWRPTWIVLTLALVFTGPWRRSARPVRGLLLATALCAVLALGLLFPLLRDGWLEPQNARLLFVPELALALLVGACGGRVRPVPQGLFLALLLLAPRLVYAWQDTHEWAAAARLGEERIAAARALVARAAPSDVPVLTLGLPRVHEGAYCLGFGLPQRFRAPFPVTPRPIWPLRSLLLEDAERPSSIPLRADGSLWPEDLERATRIELRAEDGSALGRVALDERVFAAAEDRSARFTLSAGPPGAALEALLYTDSGYEAFALGALDAEGAARATWQGVVALRNGHTSVGETLLFVAEFGATTAGLEFRALDETRRPVATSGWVELSWSPALVRRARGEPLSAR